MFRQPDSSGNPHYNTEEQSRNQGDYHKAHDALRVNGVVNVGSALRCRVRHVQETLEAIKDTLEG